MRRADYYTSLGEDAGESTLMVTTTPSGIPTRQSDWGSAVSNLLPAVLSVYQQHQLTRLNLARINSGQPPLTAAEYTNVYRPPTAEVQIGATAQTQRLLMFAGMGVLALVGLRAAKII